MVYWQQSAQWEFVYRKECCMDMQEITKPSFSVIGKEGSTEEGEGFIGRLWAEANGHFHEIAHLAKKDASGNLVGIWGAMSDFSRSFAPWEDGFAKGLYLAGVECRDDAEPPEGWVKWTIPGSSYICVENTEGAFGQGLAYLQENGLSLAGAVHDFTCPRTGKGYLFFPIRRL